MPKRAPEILRQRKEKRAVVGAKTQECSEKTKKIDGIVTSVAIPEQVCEDWIVPCSPA
jgi:hypothetical protein